MITYTWKINRLDCSPLENGLENVVKVAHWTLTATDENGVSSSISNSYPFQGATSNSFINYSDLTEEVVSGWLQNSLDTGFLYKKLSDEILSQYQPPIISPPLPWIKVEEPIIEPTVELEPIIEPTLEEMIADGYKPDARDGDGDGMVQDGTDWERPIDTL